MLAGGARAKDGVRIAHEPLGAAVTQTNWSHDGKYLSATWQTDA